MNTKALSTALTGLLLLTVLIGSCSKLKDDLTPTAPQARIHSPGWIDSTSANFHGKVLKLQQYELSGCVKCHQQTFGGGTSRVSCYLCHSSFPHAMGWSDTSSSRFHGKVLKQQQYNFSSCVNCHGASFEGGTSSIPCSRCHSSFPHVSGWTDTTARNFHGKVLKQMQYNVAACAPCHGTMYEGGTSGVACYQCHESYPHKPGWTDQTSSAYHGRYLKNKNWQTSECAACHGAAYDGGTSDKSCSTCHPSYPHSARFPQTGRHMGYLQGNQFPLAQCRTCHGAAYAGGAVVNISCLNAGCHVDRNGTAKTPEACNTCHGDFRALASDFLSAAPPKSVLGDSLTAAHGVGAHEKHLRSGTIGKPLKCQECHSVPSQVFSTGHLDSPLPAEVVMNDTLARLVTGNGRVRPAPTYNSANFTCSNSYCHGNWRLVRSRPDPYNWYIDSVMVGGNASPQWTGGGGEAACGSTCHALPPTGHVLVSVSACALCHIDVVDANGDIVSPAKHINGKINVYGQEYPFR